MREGVRRSFELDKLRKTSRADEEGEGVSSSGFGRAGFKDRGKKLPSADTASWDGRRTREGSSKEEPGLGSIPEAPLVLPPVYVGPSLVQNKSIHSSL